MIIGIPKEQIANETRVAVVPYTVKQLLKLGFSVYVEHNAGYLAGFGDLEYEKVKANIVSRDVVFSSDIILKINIPQEDEILLFKKNAVLISLIYPDKNFEIINILKKCNINVIAIDIIPHTAQTQLYDVLSSMSTVAGYRAVIEAAYEFKCFFSGQNISINKVFPVKVMVIGVGVVGFSAIRTAISLGGSVRAFDIKNEVKEDVKNIGAEFLSLDFYKKSDYVYNNKEDVLKKILTLETKLIENQIKNIDVVITSAINKEKQAPQLITKKNIALMKPGSVIVDLVAEFGGNCELTQSDKLIITDNNIKIIGYTDFPKRFSTQSSKLYSNNMINLIKILCKKKSNEIIFDFDNTIIKDITLIKDGEFVLPCKNIKTQNFIQLNSKENNIKKNKKNKNIFKIKYALIVFITVLFVLLAEYISNEFVSNLTILILSCIISYYIVLNVMSTLYTQLILLTNMISGIVIIGAITQFGRGIFINILSFIAILFSSINIFYSFSLIQRILKMFLKNKG
ncbi:Re/Si-specific NAD(P)(+) transhydrogenase subunit alpha [Candidatus Providencia siddallii]|uniref:NAD(P) transhydrogenase subunit alpha n=1 Tax=Candidatus Providencia siddallii TaxID=1715285 RepID=A0ABP1CEA9_9GAMM